MSLAVINLSTGKRKSTDEICIAEINGIQKYVNFYTEHVKLFAGGES